MGRFFTSFLMVLSLVCSPLQGFAPMNISLFNNTKVPVELPVARPVTEPKQLDATTVSSNNSYNTSSFITVDIEGYCTVQVPESHFSVKSNSTAVRKELSYKDNKTTLVMSYVTNIGPDADIPGYITKEVAGVDTTTNNKAEETHGNNVKWMKIQADKQIDAKNVYVMYTLNSNSSVAFWIQAKVSPESDDDEFNEALNQILDSYKTYGESGTIFDTPDTGIYENMDSSVYGDTSGYIANNQSGNQVFNTRGGFIANADISSTWDSMEVIIDEVKFKLPCTLNDFYNAGYEVNDRKVPANDMQVAGGGTLDLNLININGTVVTATFYNSSMTVPQDASDCKIMKLTVDSDKFVQVSSEEKEAKIKEKEEASKKKQEFDQSKSSSDDNKEDTNKQFVVTAKNVNIREKPNTNCTIYKEASPGEKYEYIRMSDDDKWYCVKYEDHEAFIRSTYATLENNGNNQSADTGQNTDNTSTVSENVIAKEDGEEEGSVYTHKVVVITSSVPVKKEASASSERVANVIRGETFEYLGVTEDSRWFKIDFFGEEAYVNAVAADVRSYTDLEYEQAQEYMDDLYGKAQADAAIENEKAENEEPSIYASDEYKDSYDEYGHQLILPGGITWTAYTDDIVNYYGTESKRLDYGASQRLKLTWDHGEKYISITTGLIKQIYAVEISCVPDKK